ncbi:MAG: tetraacyldisaccharide 4'-kinase [Deltaproteobacteria bacterium]|nr:tetraacyldisaccharide 4'-kinase [Deltaproteobacteria bacterium]
MKRVFWPDWSRIQRSHRLGPWFPILAFFSFFYGSGVRSRLWAYKRGLFKRERLPGFVLSIGNLTVGGTGKTPAVMTLAKWARDEGRRVAVLSRGFGGRYTGGLLEVSDGKHVKADPRAAGDEPCLLAGKLSGVPVIVSQKRLPAGSFAREKFGCDFFILDDGFQHLELERDLDVVLMDASNPFGNGHLLPWGPLREPVAQLARADAFILTRAGDDGPGSKAGELLKARFPQTPVSLARHVPDKVVFPVSNKTRSPGFLKGKRVVAFCGIAQPEMFKKTLSELGVDIAYFKAFHDHYKFKREDIKNLMELKKKYHARIILTTEKDWVRMAVLGCEQPDIAYLSIEFVLTSNKDQIFKMIKDGFSAFENRKVV